MHSNAISALPVLAAIAGQAQAFNSHRHAHDQAEKRGIVWETVFETVYVTNHQEAPAAKTQYFANNNPVVTSTVVVQNAPAQATPQAPAPKPADNAGINVGIDLGDLLPGTKKPKPTGSAGGSTGFAKRGIAYNDPNLAKSFGDVCQDNCGWFYNWGSSSGGISGKKNFIPTLWGDLPVHTGHWDQDAEAAIADGCQQFFSFNEPDMPSQANMSPGAAAAAHAKYMSKYAGKVKIGAPSVSNSGQAGQGLDWLKQFMAACDGIDGCQVDFCNVHWYSQAQYSDTLFTHLKDANDVCGGKPVWLTEFAPIDSDNQISSFMNDVIPKLEALDYLDGYAYFMVADSKLMSASALSSIGNIYASIKSLFA